MAYNAYKNGILTRGGGWDNQPLKLLNTFMVLRIVESLANVVANSTDYKGLTTEEIHLINWLNADE